MTTDSTERVRVGRVGGPFGVRGWVRVESWTRPPANILDYVPWCLVGPGAGRRSVSLRGSKVQGNGIVVLLEGVNDREDALRLRGMEIEVPKERLGPPGPAEFFWHDLEGMEVCNLSGDRVGCVSHLFDAGPNDVLVVEGLRRRLIPFLYGTVIRDVDLARRRITIDWLDDL